MSEPEAPIDVSIGVLDASGAGVATHGEGHVHVRGLFPGERGRVSVIARSRHRPVAHARLLEITAPSPERVPPPCSAHHHLASPSASRGRCDGCPLMPLSLPRQRHLKLMRARSLGLPVEEVFGEGSGEGYRFSAKRIVGGEVGALVLGSRAHRSAEIVGMPGCVVDHPTIVAAFDEVQRLGDELGIAPWTEGEGDLRYVWAKTDGSRVLLTLITAREDSRAATTLAPRLQSVHGVAHCVQGADHNAIRGDAARPLAGEMELQVPFGERAITVGPLGFLQPNPAVAARAYLDLISDVGGEPLRGGLAFDLFAGAGWTTARLERRFERVLACELDPANARRLGVPASDAASFLAKHRDAVPDLVVANPPRAGFDAPTRDALAELRAKRLHVMSCDPSTLARDLDALGANWTLVDVSAYDTLPHTAHLELVARLRRTSP